MPGALTAVSREALIKAAAPVSGNPKGIAEKQFSYTLLQSFCSSPFSNQAGYGVFTPLPVCNLLSTVSWY